MGGIIRDYNDNHLKLFIYYHKSIFTEKWKWPNMILQCYMKEILLF